MVLRWRAGWIKRQGGEAKIVVFDPGSLDATSMVLQAMEFKPDVVSVSTPKGLAVPIFAAAEEQGLIDKVHWMGPASLYNPTSPVRSARPGTARSRSTWS